MSEKTESGKALKFTSKERAKATKGQNQPNFFMKNETSQGGK